MGWQRVTLSTGFFVVYGRWYYRGKGLVNHTLTTMVKVSIKIGINYISRRYFWRGDVCSGGAEQLWQWYRGRDRR